MNSSRPVAVFNIDGTLFRLTLLGELMAELVRREILPKESLRSYQKAEEAYLTKGTGADSYMQKMLLSFGKHAKGVPYGIVADVAGELIEANRTNVFTYTRELAHDLKQKGYFLLAISRSPKFIVDGFGYELGFHKSYGTFFDTGASGRFTGEIVDEHLIMNKGLVLQRAVKKDRLTFSDSYGVGDSESDIPMLELVDNPVAFNPTKRLLAHARQHNWKRVVQMKDVVYDV